LSLLLLFFWLTTLCFTARSFSQVRKLYSSSTRFRPPLIPDFTRNHPSAMNQANSFYMCFMLLTYTFFWGHLFWISSIRVLFFGIPGGSLSRSVISKGSVGGKRGKYFFFSLSLSSLKEQTRKEVLEEYSLSWLSPPLYAWPGFFFFLRIARTMNEMFTSLVSLFTSLSVSLSLSLSLHV